MTYDDTITYLFNCLPAFERAGAGQYKPGLDNARALAELFDNPHRRLSTVHVAGTNGKGTTSHTLAAILSAAGYRVGLYTSPHIHDFRERMRIDGQMIPRDEVVAFVEKFLDRSPADLSPTFFELTTIMAFDWFARSGVDIAVIETGLGGRLDTTNILEPMLSIITNVSLDHTDLLGDSIEQIAAEKAGIIKPHTPVVVADPSGAEAVFESVAEQMQAPLIYPRPVESTELPDGTWSYLDGRYHGAMRGSWQPRNTSGILAAVEQLRILGLNIPDSAVAHGLDNVEASTGLRGRWTVVATSPLTVYDTGHNPGAWQHLGPMLAEAPGHKHIVLAFVADKDVGSIIRFLPREDATYYFTTTSGRRALPAEELHRMCAEAGLQGRAYNDASQALAAARQAATADDTIFIGGSNYLIASLTDL